MKKISRIGIDISRTVFQLPAVALEGELVWCKRVYRSELCDVMRQIEPCDVGIEACGGAPHVGKIQSLLVTCRLQGIDPYTYFVDVLQRVATHPGQRVSELIPR